MSLLEPTIYTGRMIEVPLQNGFTGMFERIIIDSIPQATSDLVRQAYDYCFGHTDNSSESYGLGCKRFSDLLHREMPFMGYSCFEEFSQLSADEQKQEWERYLHLFTVPRKLSELASTGQLDCISQSVAIKESLDPNDF